jgi:hypothetical protein
MDLPSLNRRQFEQLAAFALTGGQVGMNPYAVLSSATNISACNLEQLRDINKASAMIDDKNSWIEWAVICWARGYDMESSLDDYIGPKSRIPKPEVYALVKQSPIWALLKAEKKPENFPAIAKSLQDEHAAAKHAHMLRLEALDVMSKGDVSLFAKKDFNPEGRIPKQGPGQLTGSEKARWEFEATRKRVREEIASPHLSLNYFKTYVQHFLSGRLRDWCDKDLRQVAPGATVETVEKAAGAHYQARDHTPEKGERRLHRAATHQLEQELIGCDTTRPTQQDRPRLDGYVITYRGKRDPEQKMKVLSWAIQALDPQVKLQAYISPVEIDKDPHLCMTIFPESYALKEMLNKQITATEKQKAAQPCRRVAALGFFT